MFSLFFRQQIPFLNGYSLNVLAVTLKLVNEVFLKKKKKPQKYQKRKNNLSEVTIKRRKEKSLSLFYTSDPHLTDSRL